MQIAVLSQVLLTCEARDLGSPFKNQRLIEESEVRGGHL